MLSSAKPYMWKSAASQRNCIFSTRHQEAQLSQAEGLDSLDRPKYARYCRMLLSSIAPSMVTWRPQSKTVASCQDIRRWYTTGVQTSTNKMLDGFQKPTAGGKEQPSPTEAIHQTHAWEAKAQPKLGTLLNRPSCHTSSVLKFLRGCLRSPAGMTNYNPKAAFRSKFTQVLPCPPRGPES